MEIVVEIHLSSGPGQPHSTLQQGAAPLSKVLKHNNTPLCGVLQVHKAIQQSTARVCAVPHPPVGSIPPNFLSFTSRINLWMKFGSPGLCEGVQDIVQASLS